MAGNTPWASQMFPVPTQESVPASMLTGDESYSIKLVSFSKALTQLPDTQGPNQETQAVEGEEAARTADRAEGQQSLCPGHGRQHDDTRTLVAAEGTNTAGREVPRVEEPAQKAAQEVEGRPQNPPPGGSQLQKSRGSEDGGGKEQKQAAMRACGSHGFNDRSQDAGASNKRRRKVAGTSDEPRASKRRRGEEQQGEEEARSSSSLELPAGVGVDVVGVFAERLMNGMLDLASEHGVAAIMTVTADRVTLEVRLDASAT